jgi:phosphatidylglycerophosphatase A
MVAARITAMRALIIFFATGVYSGYSPFAPGTAGSVVGMILSWAVFERLWDRSPALALAIFAVAFAVACWIAGRAEEIFQEHDSPRIVIDEVLGMVFTMFGNPRTIPFYLLGFFLFRLFDVIKPFPAGLIDRALGGGIGVMLDDIAASVYANIVLQVVWRVL